MVVMLLVMFIRKRVKLWFFQSHPKKYLQRRRRRKGKIIFVIKMIWELIWVDIPKWPVRKRMMKEMAIMIKTISTWTETFQAAFQVAPMPFVIGTLFMLLMWKIRMRVVQCTTMHTMCILLLFANQGLKPEECGGEDSSTASPLKTHPDLCV